MNKSINQLETIDQTPDLAGWPELPTTSHFTGQVLDQAFKSSLARLTSGITPAGIAKIWFDWAAHLALSPGKQMELIEKAGQQSIRLLQYAGEVGSSPNSESCIKPQVNDHRFDGEEWCQFPYNVIYQAFLLHQQWWHNATTDIDGLATESERAVSFITRQLVDSYAPCNFPWINPQIRKATLAQGGMNLMRGLQNLSTDWQNALTGKRPVGTEAFKIGHNIAVTPGKVVYHNHLIELIQYSPTTDEVYAEPILFVPAWIMKYYILDLSPHNSLVKYLIDKGHTVFMISWLNPDSNDRELSLDDYRTLGPMAALDAISNILPDQKVHAVGYCLGGTLLSIAAATMARDKDDRLASISTLATQVDFTEAGELMLFVGESEVSYLENMMRDNGYLDGYQMAGAFQILRSNDLIGSRILHTYLLGEREAANDLMTWNADLTRMPYRMHSEYLRNLFMHNDLASGRYLVGGRPVVINDIRVPILAVGTIKDHVAPWTSVYKIHLLADTDEVTFLLVSGGHNAGIVSEPGHKHRSYQIRTVKEQDQYIDPDTWRETTQIQSGSWWPAWQKWLAERSSGTVAAPNMGAAELGYAPLVDAPGTYVHQS